MQTTYLVFTLLTAAAIAGVFLWLRRRMAASGVRDAPVGRLFVVVLTYGIAIYVVASLLLFFDDTLSTSTAIDPSGAASGVLVMIVPVLYVYVIFIAPVVMLIVGLVSFIKKGDSVYHRLVYLGCAGYTFLLFVLLIVMTSRCSTPPGGIP